MSPEAQRIEAKRKAIRINQRGLADRVDALSELLSQADQKINEQQRQINSLHKDLKEFKNSLIILQVQAKGTGPTKI